MNKRTETKEELAYSCEDVIKSVNKKIKPIGFADFDHREGITVEALCVYCIQEILAGNAQKHIQISCDDEGNGFHTLFYGFSSDKDSIDAYDYHDDVNKKNIILLG